MQPEVTSSLPSAGAETTRGVAHTPGPWRVEVHRPFGRKPRVLGEGQRYITDVGNAEADPSDIQRHLANARLIAAAPDLLTALRSVLDAFAATAPDTLTFAQANALASARATVAAADRGGRDG